MDICKTCGCDKSLTVNKKCPVCERDSESLSNDLLSKPTRKIANEAWNYLNAALAGIRVDSHEYELVFHAKELVNFIVKNR